MFERLAYYGPQAVLAIYLHEYLGLTTEQTAWLIGYYGFVVWFMPIFGGALADRFGFRHTLAGAFFILGLGNFLLGSLSAQWMAPVREALPLFALMHVLMLIPAMGPAVVKPVVVGTTARAAKENVRSLGYSIYYTVVNVGAATLAAGVTGIVYGSGNDGGFAATSFGTGLSFLAPTLSLDADRVTLAAPTAWRMFLSDGSSVITEVQLGAQYTLLQSGGPAAAFTWTGTLNFDPLVAPNGANPTTDAAGEIAVDTSAGAGSMFRFYGAAAYALPAYQSVSATIKGTTTDENYPLWKFPYQITIRAIKVYAIGGTNVIGGLHECTGTNGVCSGKTAVDADITGTAGSEVSDDGSLTNAVIAAGNYIQWYTTTANGTNTSVTITMYYTVDQVN